MLADLVGEARHMSQSPGQVDIFAIEKDSPVKSADKLEFLPADKQTSTAAPVRFHRDGVVDLRMLVWSLSGFSGGNLRIAAIRFDRLDQPRQVLLRVVGNDRDIDLDLGPRRCFVAGNGRHSTVIHQLTGGQPNAQRTASCGASVRGA